MREKLKKVIDELSGAEFEEMLWKIRQIQPVKFKLCDHNETKIVIENDCCGDVVRFKRCAGCGKIINYKVLK